MCIRSDNRDFLHDGTYETMNLGPFTVEAVPAGNRNHDIRYCVGYVVTVDGINTRIQVLKPWQSDFFYLKNSENWPKIEFEVEQNAVIVYNYT